MHSDSLENHAEVFFGGLLHKEKLKIQDGPMFVQ